MLKHSSKVDSFLFCLMVVVKNQLLLSLRTESFELSRRAICGVIAMLAESELKKNQWMDILTQMKEVHNSFAADV
jgi:hypothetical protein